jgi:hypothetical protein
MKRHWFVPAVVACFGIAACAQLPSDLAQLPLPEPERAAAAPKPAGGGAAKPTAD